MFHFQVQQHPIHEHLRCWNLVAFQKIISWKLRLPPSRPMLCWWSPFSMWNALWEQRLRRRCWLDGGETSRGMMNTLKWHINTYIYTHPYYIYYRTLNNKWEYSWDIIGTGIQCYVIYMIHTYQNIYLTGCGKQHQTVHGCVWKWWIFHQFATSTSCSCVFISHVQIIYAFKMTEGKHLRENMASGGVFASQIWVSIVFKPDSLARQATSQRSKEDPSASGSQRPKRSDAMLLQHSELSHDLGFVVDFKKCLSQKSRIR